MNAPSLEVPVVLRFGESEISQRRLDLLRAIDSCQSISGAAKAVGMTYKAAWDAVDAINNLAGTLIVSVTHGGKGGGGALLTEEGRRILVSIERLDFLKKSFFSQLGSEELRLTDQLLRRLQMKTSAQNALSGTVSEIKKGAVNSEVILKLPGGENVYAIITNESVAELGLAAGKEAFALIKASWILLAVPDAVNKTSARNRLCGKVIRIQEGPVNAEVVLELSGRTTLTAIITKDSLTEMKIEKGQDLCALIKASHVIIGVN